MQNFVGKINGQVIEGRSLTDDDIRKIQAKAEIIALEAKPEKAEDLKPHVYYTYPLTSTDNS